MAEIMLKIGDGPTLDDGHPIHAFTDRKILLVNADRLCNWRLAGFAGNGLRPTGSLAEEYMTIANKYKFERVSQREVRRTELDTGATEMFSDVPRLVDGRDQHIYVEEYVAYATRNANNHNVFGEPGAEVWYGGSVQNDEARVLRMWNKIEEKSEHRRQDHAMWPAGRLDTQHHFMFHAIPFSDDDARSLLASAPMPGIEDGDFRPRKLHKAPWADTLGISGPTEEDIRNPGKNVERKPEIRHNLRVVFPTWR